jgi:hypothetical protein
MTKVKTRPVNLVAREAVEIEPNVFLPAGTYTAVEKQLGMATMGGVSWTRPEYKIELTAEQLGAMGMKHSANLISVEFDVSKFVRAGNLAVA